MKFNVVHLAFAAFIITVCVITGTTAQTYMTFMSRAEIGGERVKVSGILFKPGGVEVHPAIILLHACGGVKEHVTRNWPEFLTGLGYVVLTVDSYTPRGWSRCTDFQGTGAAIQAEDAHGALEYLAGLPFVDGNRVAVMGFSTGATAINGPISNEVVEEGGRNFRVGIAIYGDCGHIGSEEAPSIPLMQIVPEKDRHALWCIESGKDFSIEVHVLQGADRTFDQPSPIAGELSGAGSGGNNLYSFEATSEAESHVKSFLAKHLGK